MNELIKISEEIHQQNMQLLRTLRDAISTIGEVKANFQKIQEAEKGLIGFNKSFKAYSRDHRREWRNRSSIIHPSGRMTISTNLPHD